MNNSFRILLYTIALFIQSNLFAQNLSEAGTYLNTINEQCGLITDDMMSYRSAASHSKRAKKIEKKRSELMQSIKVASQNVRRLKPFKGDAALRDSAVAYFQITGTVLNEDYGKIVNMEEVAEQSYDLMEAYMLAKEKAGLKADEAFKKFDNQYRAFAKQYNIRLIEGDSKVSKKIEEANEVLQYYNPIYLLFFKSYKNEAYFLDALNKGDISALEQTKDALQNSSVEGLKKVVSMPAYKADKSLKVACDKILTFYQSESSTKSTEITDYFLKKENFEKSKKAMDAKRAADRIQSDIDNFNKLVADYNNSVNSFNKLINDFNKRRNEAFDLWNKTADDFLDNHVPKHR
jgi:hypothetical protein